MTDPFATLGIDPTFDLDLKSVEARHRELSRALHPDRYAQAPAAERRMALSRAIEVNEAWRAVRDPIKRAEALFRKLGVPSGETAEPNPSTELLMEMMEAREELAGAARAKDMEAVHRLSMNMQFREREVLAALGRGFAEAKGDADAARKLIHYLGELRYLRRFLDEAAAIEESAHL
ncbi:MAG: Fe-S protein assembly co-chaperone HscB [Polyangiaceae bacterium]